MHDQPLSHALILTADVGFGHMSAANAVQAALLTRYGHTCTVEIVNPLRVDAAPRLMRQNARDYDRLVRHWPRLYGLAYSATNRRVANSLVNRLYTSLLQAVLQRILTARPPQLIVITYPYYQAPLRAACTAGGVAPKLLTVVTDFVTIHRCWFHAGAHACCVPTAYAAQRAANWGFEADKVHVTGIPVHPDFAAIAEDAHTLRLELGWQTDRPTLLVMGSKRVEQLDMLLARINHTQLPLQLAVVCGGDDTLQRRLRAMEWRLPVHIYGFTEDVPRLMHAADWVMSKAGGLTTAEALACGRPLLLIGMIPGQEQGNAEYVVGHGAGKLLAGVDETVQLLTRWCEPGAPEPLACAAAARRLGRPHAAYEIADLGWALLQQRAISPPAQTKVDLRRA